MSYLSERLLSQISRNNVNSRHQRLSNNIMKLPCYNNGHHITHTSNTHLLQYVYLISIFIISYTTVISSAFADSINHVTCGSVIKLSNEAKPKFRLHSHDIKYGSGSGQQSVTAVENQDTNSYWAVMGEKTNHCTRGEPIECGSTIRLQHVQTRKYLHSHLFKSPLSSQQEVSAFGNDQESDTGDHWMVYCRSRYWQKGDSVKMKHADTDSWLSLSGNIYGRPIFGQLEVVCTPNSDSTSSWKTTEGVYVQPTVKTMVPPTHDEL